MSDQYTSNQKNAFQGSLVDNSFKPENMGTPNHPPPGDTTSEGGYGGDPFDRKHQAPAEHGQFRSKETAFDQPIRTGAVSEREFEQHAGEGIVSPNEAAGAQATSSGTNEDVKQSSAKFVPANDPTNHMGA